MARTKSKTEQAKLAAARVLQDKDLQKQIRTATVRVREAWTRISGRPASKSFVDKKVHATVGEAAASVAAVSRSLRRKPEPKHTARKVAAVAVVGGGAALAVKKKRSSGDQQFTPVQVEPTGPVAAPTPPTPVTSA
jgi:hypothetical protein